MEHLFIGMDVERRMALVVDWAETFELATASAKPGELTDERDQVNVCFQLARGEEA